MADAFDHALARFITACPYVVAVRELATKWRIELIGGYMLDLHFNETLGKYSYALLQSETRILVWDNAPHHPGLPGFPHHAHRMDGRVVSPGLAGDPGPDLETVRREVEAFLASQLPKPN